MIKELDTGFLQLVLLGVSIPGEIVRRQKANWEGDLVAIKFADIEQVLTSQKTRWVHSGLVNVLLWLRLGAPNSDISKWPRNQKPMTIYRNVLKTL